MNSEREAIFQCRYVASSSIDIFPREAVKRWKKRPPHPSPGLELAITFLGSLFQQPLKNIDYELDSLLVIKHYTNCTQLCCRRRNIVDCKENVWEATVYFSFTRASRFLAEGDFRARARVSLALPPLTWVLVFCLVNFLYSQSALITNAFFMVVW